MLFWLFGCWSNKVESWDKGGKLGGGPRKHGYSQIGRARRQVPGL